jgi:hypothetical protein
MQLACDQLQYWLSYWRCAVYDFWRADFTNKLTRRLLITKPFYERGKERVNPSPDPSILFPMYIELYRTSTCCWRVYFKSLGQDSDSFPAHHGGRQLWHPTIACGTAAPQPSTQASSTHHGGCCLHLVWDQSTGGASGEYHHHQCECVFLFVNLRCWWSTSFVLLLTIFPLPSSTHRHPMRERGGDATTSRCSATRERWRNERGAAACYLSKVICASVVSVRASPNTVASWA